jgi:hypothetical protein
MSVSMHIRIQKPICPTMDAELQAHLCIHVCLNSAANLFKHGSGDQTQFLLFFFCMEGCADAVSLRNTKHTLYRQCRLPTARDCTRSRACHHKRKLVQVRALEADRRRGRGGLGGLDEEGDNRVELHRPPITSQLGRDNALATVQIIARGKPMHENANTDFKLDVCTSISVSKGIEHSGVAINGIATIWIASDSGRKNKDLRGWTNVDVALQLRDLGQDLVDIVGQQRMLERLVLVDRHGGRNHNAS